MKTAECVTPKHPDKMCDQISDAILDYCLTQDPNARVAVETMGGHGNIRIMGEVTFNGEIKRDDVFALVERITGEQQKDIEISIVKQSPEIAQGVDAGGAGDQGICSGYACSDNEAMIPQELYLARSLCKFLYEKFPYDGKTQITLNDKGDIETAVASFQNVPRTELIENIQEWINLMYNKEPVSVQVFANPAGDWHIGGFDADTGLTGRKLIIDNFGPNVPVGGGAFSGKDGTKVDRSAAYMARHLAIRILKGMEAKEVFVRLAYVIGKADPLMAEVIVDGESYDLQLMAETFDSKRWPLKPQEIISYLELQKPQYEETAKWGHFGNNFKWDEC